MNGKSEAVNPRRHNGVDHQASPEEIERDLARTRADINDTLSAIEHRLSPGELMDQALDYFRGGPREFAVNLGEQARDNPLPVALTAVGIGWLMYATRHGGRPHEMEYTSEGIPESGADISGRTREAYGSARESMHGMGEKVSAKSGEMRERAGEKVASAREGVSRAAENLRERARSMRSGMRQGGADTASAIRQGGEKARGTFSYMLNEQPLVLGMLGLALGAVIGTGIPTTERERETLGPARDKAMDRAREMST